MEVTHFTRWCSAELYFRVLVSMCIYNAANEDCGAAGSISPGAPHRIIWHSTNRHLLGTKVLYALPGIANWSFPVPIDGLTPTAMPRDSTLTVNLSQDPTDFENTFASPQLPDAGSLTWKSKIDVYAPPVVEYRLKADSLKPYPGCSSICSLLAPWSELLVAPSCGLCNWSAKQDMGPLHCVPSERKLLSIKGVTALQLSTRCPGLRLARPANQRAQAQISGGRGAVSPGLGWPSTSN